MCANTTVHLAAPCLLVAMPHLRGSPFAQAVLVLTKHNDEGSMGLVVNKPGGMTSSAFTGSMGLRMSRPEQSFDAVHMGGPVEMERAFILHGGGHRGPETQVLNNDLALSFSMESLQALAQDTPEHMRICVGYAGWGTLQLAHEISRSDWLVAPMNTQLVFATPPQAMWHEALRSMGIEPLQLLQRPAAAN